MSKSYGNTIPLFAEDDETRKIVMSIVTDSKGADEPKDPSKCNIFSLHKLFSKPTELSKIKKDMRRATSATKSQKNYLPKTSYLSCGR